MFIFLVDILAPHSCVDRSHLHFRYPKPVNPKHSIDKIWQKIVSPLFNVQIRVEVFIPSAAQATQLSLQPGGSGMGQAEADSAAVDNVLSTQSTPHHASHHASDTVCPLAAHLLRYHAQCGPSCSSLAVGSASHDSQNSLIIAGEALASASYSLSHGPDAPESTEKVSGPSTNPRDSSLLAGIRDHDGTFLPGYTAGYERKIPSWPTEASGVQHDGIDRTVTFDSPPNANSTEVEEGISSYQEHIPDYRRPNNSGGQRELSPNTATGSVKTKWSRAVRWERVILCSAIFFMVSTFIGAVCAFKLHGQGRKTFVRKIFVWGVLIMDFNVGVVMVALRRNLGEVLFSITLVLVFGIFLNSYLDVLGYGPT
jgi:hypothetical protein